jgi:hypothetical protein
LKEAKLSGEVKLAPNSQSNTGKQRNNPAPLTRCKIETLPGNGSLIVVKSKFFGRFLMVISAMNVIPRVKMRLSAFTWFEKNCNYTFKTRQSTPPRALSERF